jgi:hypothetical protein
MYVCVHDVENSRGKREKRKKRRKEKKKEKYGRERDVNARKTRE